MKQVTINEKCVQCGVCAIKCPAYFAEDDSGDIRVLASAVEETPELRDAVTSCPQGAIVIGKEVSTKESLQKYVKELETLMEGLKVTREDIAFHEAWTRRVLVPSAGSSGYEYRSSSQAESAGLDAFIRRTYSQMDNLILERITDYRTTQIRPYYTADERSAYTKYNSKIEAVLESIAAIIGSEKLPSDFCRVSIYPDSSDLAWKMLNRGELIADNLIGTVKREMYYSSASGYKTYIDYDDTEDYRGKTKYCYRTYEACEEFGRDLGSALSSARSDIEDNAMSMIKSLLISYNDQIKKCIQQKLTLIKKYL